METQETRKRFDYRLVEEEHRESIEVKNEPVDLDDTVTYDTTISVMINWPNRNEFFGQKLLERGVFNFPMPSTSHAGWINYSYRLERKPVDGDEWELVGYICSNCDYTDEFEPTVFFWDEDENANTDTPFVFRRR
ncbi:hypothetical protein ACFL0Z_03390 [Patescibacteria group bacterium]